MKAEDYIQKGQEIAAISPESLVFLAEMIAQTLDWYQIAEGDETGYWKNGLLVLKGYLEQGGRIP